MRRGPLIALVALLAGASVAAQWALARRSPARTGSGLSESAFAALGGFRSLAAEVVWFRADRLQDEGRFVELAQLAHALTLAEPHTPEIWSYAAWNLAYNVSVMMPTHEDRWRWVVAALSLLRDAGLRYNPKSAEIHNELALLFELKMGLDLDEAAPLYRAKWRDLVADVASRDAWAAELKMDDAAVMREVETGDGVTDRGDPLYSALYWARRGLKFARTPLEHAKLNEVIRQSRGRYFRNRGIRLDPNA